MTRKAQTGRIQRRSASSTEPRSLAALLPRPLRLAAFSGLVLLVGFAAIGLLVGRLAGPAPIDAAAIAVRADMGGFDPPSLTMTAGETVRIEFASLDTPFHSDGGGWHQFAVDELGVDWKVGPQSSEVFELVVPQAPGTYTWYCDICCGGKENPSMQGTLRVEA